MPHDISLVWDRIKNHENEIFKTKTGLDFSYSVDGKVLVTTRTDFNISISEFKKTLERVPLEGPGGLSSDVHGYSYVWAILHDPRISNNEW